MNTTGYIYNSENGKCIASIDTTGAVYDITTEEKRQIGTVRDGNIYDLEDNLLGHLGDAGNFSGGPTPEPFKKLIKNIDV